MSMRKVSRVLILFKKSTFQIQAVERQDPRFLKLLDEGNTSVARVKSAHDEHYETLQALERELKKRKIEYVPMVRADLQDSADEFDLVISVGGDGTFLDASHFIRNAPLLGINSARSSSFGHFCLGHIDNLANLLDDLCSGKIEPHPLLRLELFVNGRAVPQLVTNEVLVCHSNPAGTSRYYISIDAAKEEQRSSGIWIGTPAGSTGSLKSAGGSVMPITQHRYQYIVREPWERPGQRFQLTSGLLEKQQEIHLTSGMRTGMLFVDGSHICHSFSLGDELMIKVANNDLLAFVNPEVNQIFFEAK
jgi:NAD+ kinase